MIKKPTLSVLHSRLKCLGQIEHDTKVMVYYTDVLQGMFPEDDKISVSWVENLFNPHPKANLINWKKRVDYVLDRIGELLTDELELSDMSLYLDLKHLKEALLTSVHELGHRLEIIKYNGNQTLP